MKSVFAAIMVVIAIFTLSAGIFAMNHMDSGDHANCLAAIPGQPGCSGNLDPVQFAIRHINAFLAMSLGITGSLVAVLFSSLILLAWLAAPDISKTASIASDCSGISIEGNARSVYKQRRWISILEGEEPFSFRAVNA